MCGKFFDSKRKLKDHKDNNHRMSSYVTATRTDAQRIAHDILSSNHGILAVAVIDRSGNILAGESGDSFNERYQVDSLGGSSGSSYGGSLAIATLGVINEVKAAFGEPQAIITIHENCKLMLLPMLSYDTLIGLVLERSAKTDDDKLANDVERLVAHILKL